MSATITVNGQQFTICSHEQVIERDGSRYTARCRLPPPGILLGRHAHCTCPAAWPYATPVHHHPLCMYYEDDSAASIESAYEGLSPEARRLMPPNEEWRRDLAPGKLKERGPFRTFRVRGQGGSFPLDMLRYDCAWPATEEDSAMLQAAVSYVAIEKEQPIVTVTLRTPANGSSTPSRWASYGWRVLDKGEP